MSTRPDPLRVALLPAGTAGLDRDSVVMAHQIRTISKRRLSARLGTVDDEELRAAVRAALRVQLDPDC
jgi:mRNA interferase MazF